MAENADRAAAIGAARTHTLESGAVVREWRPTGPARGTVVVQHGFAEHGQRYVSDHAQLVPHLLAREYVVWAPDLLGHGTSPGRHRVVSVQEAVLDHLDVRRRAAEDLPMVLFGHSLGGLVTAGSVAADAGGLAGVVLSAPVLVRDTSAPVRALASALGRLLSAWPLPGHEGDLSALSPRQDVLDRVATDPLMHLGPVPFLVGTTSLAESHDVWAATDRWRTPTLLVHGTDDTSTDPTVSAAFADRLAADDVTVHLVPHGYHEPLNDVDGESTRDLIVAWIDQHLQTSRGDAHAR